MTENTAPILEMTGISKSFTAVKALEDVDFRLRAVRFTRSWARTVPASRRC